MTTLTRITQALRRKRTQSEDNVRFHQGPQGLPVPCFDPACPNPHLAQG
jgi:hypothetical protein